MKTIITALAFLVLGIWIGYIAFHQPADVTTSETATDTTEVGAEGEETEVEATAEINQNTEGEVQVNPDLLSTDQKEMLERFGIDTNGIVITTEMIVCAEEKIGTERLNEIKAGATPTFFEGLSLMSCYNL